MQVTARRTINQTEDSTVEREWLLNTQKDFYVFFRGEGRGKELFNADATTNYIGEGKSPIMKLNIVSASGGGSSVAVQRDDEEFVPWTPRTIEEAEVEETEEL